MTDKNAPIVIGYYRYTDIFFDWQKVVDDLEDFYPVKAFLSKEALASPEHPFRQGDDKGVCMYIGTLPHGQARLMFSSAQVEYARYYAHAMGLSKNLVPLPSSEFLLTDRVLRDVSKVHYKTAEEIKHAIKMIDKSNRKLKGADSALSKFRQDFEKVRSLYASRKGAWLSIDLEEYDKWHEYVLEFGWSMVRWDGETKVESCGHYIVQEHLLLQNGYYKSELGGHRDHYQFGESETLPRKTIKAKVQKMLADLQEEGPLFLVFHDATQDLKCLFQSPYFEAPLEDVTFFLPTDIPTKGTFVIDTTELFGALEGESGEKRSLYSMCKLLKIPTKHLHNAGNDAYYTLLALKEMASGNHIDKQCEERFPQQRMASSEFGSSFKVRHNPMDEDSDHSELDGVANRLISKEDYEKHVAGLQEED